MSSKLSLPEDQEEEEAAIKDEAVRRSPDDADSSELRALRARIAQFESEAARLTQERDEAEEAKRNEEFKVARLTQELDEANGKLAALEVEHTALRAAADRKEGMWKKIEEESLKDFKMLSLASAEEKDSGFRGSSLRSVLLNNPKPRLHNQQFKPSLADPSLALGKSKSPQQTKSAAFPPLLKYQYSNSSKPGQRIVTRQSPEKDKAKEEIGVARWFDFDRHLKKAEMFELSKKESSEMVSVWKTLLELPLSDDTIQRVLGNFWAYQSHAMDEAAVTSAFFLSVGALVLCLFNRLNETFALSTDISGGAPPNIALPSLRSHFRPDIFWQIFRPGLLNVLVLMEMKVPWKFPARCPQGGSADENEAPFKDLYTFYVEEEAGRKHSSNVLMQIRAYLAVFQRKFGVICGLNCYTFVCLDKDQNFLVSDRYWVDKDYEDMSLLEGLMRFILAAAHEGDILDQRPAFMEKFLVDRALNNDKFDPRAMDQQPEGSSAGSSSSSASSSSSGAMAGGIAEQLRSFTQHRPFSWLDLEDPRRNDGTFTKHEQTCQPLGAHEGDAKLIAVGRVGEVYEKEFDGVRTVSKLLSMTGKRGKDEGDVDEVYNEMLREFQAYRKLETLQGKVVPRLLNCGYLIRGIVFMLSTEWSGTQINQEALSPSQRREARDKLRKIHSLGVIHGDIHERNILINPARNGDSIVFIDFGFAKFRDDDANLDGDHWNRMCDAEFDQLERLLGSTTPSKENEHTPTRKRIRSMAPEQSESSFEEECPILGPSG